MILGLRTEHPLLQRPHVARSSAVTKRPMAWKARVGEMPVTARDQCWGKEIKQDLISSVFRCLQESER